MLNPVPFVGSGVFILVDSMGFYLLKIKRGKCLPARQCQALSGGRAENWVEGVRGKKREVEKANLNRPYTKYDRESGCLDYFMCS